MFNFLFFSQIKSNETLLSKGDKKKSRVCHFRGLFPLPMNLRIHEARMIKKERERTGAAR